MKRTRVDNLSVGAFLILCFVYFFGLSGLIFGRFLIQTNYVISIAHTDIDRYFFPIRSFLSQQIRAGHLPLWNPYIFGGVPALGNFQYAALYPPTWLHLILPAASAINLIVAFHVAMAGFFTAAWSRYRGTSVIAALLAGTIFMLSGPLQVRIYAGHVTSICTAAWIPAVFICVDAILDRKHVAIACYAGGIVIAMQLLAGYPQITYCSLLAVIVYAVIRLINQPHWVGRVTRISAMYFLGAALTAVQILPGLEAVSESVRSEALPYSFATAFSVPPENLLTLIAPQIFGDGIHSDIFARWAMTENSLFIGAGGLMLTFIALNYSRTRSDIAIALIAAIFLLLALGRYTPVYQLAFSIIPGIDRLHAPAKFAFMFTLGVSILAGRGFDQLRQVRRLRSVLIVGFAFAFLLGISAMLIWQSASSSVDGLWGKVLLWLIHTGQSWGSLEPDTAARKIADSAHLASFQLCLAAISFFLICFILLIQSRYRNFVYLLPALALVELLLGAHLFWQRTQPSVAFPREWDAQARMPNPESRVLITQGTQQNLPAMLGIESIGGYDPLIPRRWANLVMPLLGVSPQSGDLMVERFLPSSRWAMLRLGTLLPPNKEIALVQPMPRLNLIDHFSVVAGPEASLEAIRRPAFDPRKLIVLESPPDQMISPVDSDELAGEVHLVRMSTDDLEIKATLNRASILLITDAFSSGWRVRTIEEGPQQTYSVMPANHALRAIPLAAGHHRFVLEYCPRWLTAGMMISGATIAMYAAAGIWMLISRRVRGGASATSLPADYQSPSA